MRRQRKQLPAFLGEARFRSRNFEGPVGYEILGDPAGLKFGPLRLKGSFKSTPEIAAQAFHDGEGILTLETGAAFRITLLGHTTGSDVAYFELRV